VSAATLADVLEARDGPGDAARATEVRRSAVAEARRLGLTTRAAEWASRVATVPECRRDGRVWTLRLDDRAAVVPHSVGMDYLTTLLARPDVEIGAVDLASGHALTCRGRTAGAVLDARAAAGYRRRIDELREEIDDADRCADLDRAAHARLELDAVLDELRAASGLGGRIRSFTDDAERARVSVHKALKRALAMIAEVDGALGEHLTARIVTGTRCVYRTAPAAVASPPQDHPPSDQ